MIENFLDLVVNQVSNVLVSFLDIFTPGPGPSENINSSVSYLRNFFQMHDTSISTPIIIQNHSLDELLLLESLTDSFNSNLTELESRLERTAIELSTPINALTSARHSFNFFMNQHPFFANLSVVRLAPSNNLCSYLNDIIKESEQDRILLSTINQYNPLFSFFNTLPQILIIIKNHLSSVSSSMGSLNYISLDQRRLYVEFYNICIKDRFWEPINRLNFFEEVIAEKDVTKKEEMIQNWVDNYSLFVEQLKKFHKDNSCNFCDSREVTKKFDSLQDQIDDIQRKELNEMKILLKEIKDIIKNNKKDV